MKRESREVFVSDDGKVFDTAAACEAHEKAMLERQQALVRLKVWRVSHGFDGTEGRGYFARTLVVSDADPAVLIQWCLDSFGYPLQRWYGDGYFEAWHLHAPSDDSTVEWALAQVGTVPCYGHRPVKLRVISQKDWAWAGLPKSEFPWPRPAPLKK